MPTTGNEPACIVGFDIPGNLIDGRNVSLDELRELAVTAGIDPLEIIRTRQAAVHPAFFVGAGKVDEIAAACGAHDIHLVLFDHDLTPRQTRNLEERLQAKVLDRTGIILQIFAQRARSREGQLQVELAQYEYLLPRLTNLWSHLSRQYGGAGTRGPGEKQLEVDRRRVQARIDHLEAALDAVRRQRATQRKQRQKSDIPVIAIVGYTNSGKSTFMRALTKADVLIEDKLFATLDPTTRRYRLPSGECFIFIDTVGFIRNLPHMLVESFKATLEEVHEADILLHLADGAAPDLGERIEAVHCVLRELDADEKPQVLALNKIDLLSHQAKRALAARYEDAALISARFKYGFAALLERLQERIPATRRRTSLRIPAHKSLLLSQLYQQGKVLSARYEQDAVIVEAFVPASLESQVRRYRRRTVS